LNQYYKADHQINNRKFEDATKPNNKLVNSFPTYITDMNTGYFMGRPVEYSFFDDEYKDAVEEINDFNNEEGENADLAKDASIFGYACELLYLDNEANINLEEIKGGEWREYKLVLTKKEGVDISQTISNNVEILSTSFEETTLDDNKDKNDLVILPRTGFIVSIKENKIPITIGIITFNIITLGAIIVRARKRAKLEN
jgi:hypothetical protein